MAPPNNDKDVLKVLIDEASLKQAVAQLPTDLPVRFWEVFIEPGKFLVLKVSVEKKSVKLKIAPMVVEGKLSFRIVKVFAGGININLSGALGFLAKPVNQMLSQNPLTKDLVRMDGSFIHTEFASNFAGITDQSELFFHIN